MSIRYSWLFFCLLGLPAFGQVIAPVQVTPQVLPPYSVYLADYAQVGNERLRLILVQQDLTQPSYQLRLKMSLKQNGREIIRLRADYVPAPLTVEAQVPQLISGEDLAPYLDAQNWEFVGGFNRAQYEQTKALPEGAYELCFTAYSYARPDVQLSNVGCAFYFLSKNEPPLVNTPACGTKIPAQTPNQMLFSWMPRNTSSPTSAQDTEYKLQLFEVRPKGRNINDVVLSSPAVFEAITDFPQYVYGVADPPLLDSMEYAWRVQARDKSGRDAFRNQGFSQVCSFTYGGLPQGFTVGVPTGFKGTALSKTHIKYEWTAEEDTFDLYRLEYKKVGQGYEWFSRETDKFLFSVWDVSPDTEYEARLQGKKRGIWGNYTPLVSVRTPKDIPAQCGDSLVYPEADLSKPLLSLSAGTQLDARGMEMHILEAEALPAAGHFRGKGFVVAPWLGGRFKVVFQDLYIDENLVLGEGRIDFVSQGIRNFVDGELADQKARQRFRQQQANRLRFADLNFYGDIFVYNDRSIRDVRVTEDGKVEITDETGKVIVHETLSTLRADNPDKAFLIQDKNGDQWVIKPDGTVEKAEGGGLPPVRPLSSEALRIIRIAMRQLREEYTILKVNDNDARFAEQERLYKLYLAQQTPSGNTSPSPADAPPTRVYGVRKTKISPTNTEAKTYKDGEKTRNLGLAIHLFCAEHTREPQYNVIGNGLVIGTSPYPLYIQTELEKKTPEAVLVAAVKEAVVKVIAQIMQDIAYKKLSSK